MYTSEYFSEGAKVVEGVSTSSNNRLTNSEQHCQSEFDKAPMIIEEEEEELMSPIESLSLSPHWREDWQSPVNELWQFESRLNVTDIASNNTDNTRERCDAQNDETTRSRSREKENENIVNEEQRTSRLVKSSNVYQRNRNMFDELLQDKEDHVQPIKVNLKRFQLRNSNKIVSSQPDASRNDNSEHAIMQTHEHVTYKQKRLVDRAHKDSCVNNGNDRYYANSKVNVVKGSKMADTISDECFVNKWKMKRKYSTVGLKSWPVEQRYGYAQHINKHENLFINKLPEIAEKMESENVSIVDSPILESEELILSPPTSAEKYNVGAVMTDKGDDNQTVSFDEAENKETGAITFDDNVHQCKTSTTLLSCSESEQHLQFIDREHAALLNIKSLPKMRGKDSMCSENNTKEKSSTMHYNNLISRKSWQSKDPVYTSVLQQTFTALFPSHKNNTSMSYKFNNININESGVDNINYSKYDNDNYNEEYSVENEDDDDNVYTPHSASSFEKNCSAEGYKHVSNPSSIMVCSKKRSEVKCRQETPDRRTSDTNNNSSKMLSPWETHSSNRNGAWFSAIYRNNTGIPARKINKKREDEEKEEVKVANYARYNKSKTHCIDLVNINNNNNDNKHNCTNNIDENSLTPKWKSIARNNNQKDKNSLEHSRAHGIRSRFVSVNEAVVQRDANGNNDDDDYHFHQNNIYYDEKNKYTNDDNDTSGKVEFVREEVNTNNRAHINVKDAGINCNSNSKIKRRAHYRKLNTIDSSYTSIDNIIEEGGKSNKGENSVDAESKNGEEPYDRNGGHNGKKKSSWHNNGLTRERGSRTSVTSCFPAKFVPLHRKQWSVVSFRRPDSRMSDEVNSNARFSRLDSLNSRQSFCKSTEIIDDTLSTFSQQPELLEDDCEEVIERVNKK